MYLTIIFFFKSCLHLTMLLALATPLFKKVVLPLVIHHVCDHQESCKSVGNKVKILRAAVPYNEQIMQQEFYNLQQNL